MLLRWQRQRSAILYLSAMVALPSPLRCEAMRSFQDKLKVFNMTQKHCQAQATMYGCLPWHSGMDRQLKYEYGVLRSSGLDNFVHDSRVRF